MNKENQTTKLTALRAGLSGELQSAWRINPSGFIFPIAIALSNAVYQLISVYLPAFVIDSLTVRRDINEILMWVIIAMAVMAALHVSGAMLGERNQLNIHTSIRELNRLVSLKAITMDYVQVDSPAVNEIRRKMDSDEQYGNGVLGIFNSFNQFLTGAVSAVSAAMVCVPMFYGLPVGAAAVMIAAVAAFTFVPSMYAVKRTNKKYYALMEEFNSRKSPFMYFAYGKGIGYKEGKDIRVYRADKLIESYIEREEEDFTNDWRRQLLRLATSSGVVMGIGASGLVAAAYVFFAYLALSGDISAGDIVKYVMAIVMFSQAVITISDSSSTFINSAKHLKSRTEFLNIPEIMRKGVIPVEKRSDNKYEIEFKNVSFKYPGSSEYALKNVSIKFNIGTRLAAVGQNGSGKTTLIKLLCRLYDPTEGVITLNGIDIRRYKYHEYMSLFSVVFQDFRLFSFSIGENIAAGGDYDKDKATECMTRAGLDERLGRLENGVDTCLYKDFEESGIEISGGEAQKMAIARALYKDAPFIILDESTAALDPLAEYEIYSKFDDISGDKTTVYISHRLSSCRFCDEIAVFDEGRIIETGTHDALVAAGGKYKQMWEAQAQYYVK